jgi:hypothetical protein
MSRSILLSNLHYFHTLSAFKVVPSSSNSGFPTLLPLLEFFLECILYDGAMLRHRILLNLLNVLEMMSFQNGFQFGESCSVLCVILYSTAMKYKY